MGATDVDVVADRLNAPPFNQELSLVTFDEKAGAELLQVLFDVIAELDGSGKPVDVRDADQAALADRVFRVMQIVKYPLPSGDL